MTLEMPNSAAESSADEVLTEGGSPARAESLTSIRLRDVKTGKFVAGASLVTKSFVPGKGWVKATDVGAKTLRRAAADRPKWKADARRKSFEESIDYRGHNDQILAHIRDMRTKGKGTVPAGKAERATPDMAEGLGMRAAGLKAYAVHAGGRKGERMIVTPRGTDKATLNHEMAHIRPKRSGYRMYQVVKDPQKAMREEARADMESKHVGDYYKFKKPLARRTTSGYTQSARYEAKRKMIGNQQKSAGTGKDKLFTKESVGAYKETQDKIAGARGYDRMGAPPKGSDTKNQYHKSNTVRRTLAGGGAAYFGYGAYKDHKKEPVKKRFNLRSLKGLGEATAAGVAAGFIANQLPQNRRTWKSQKKKLDEDLSVGLKKIKE